MTERQLAEISGVSEATIDAICSGKRPIGSCKAKTVLLLSEALGLPMELLMTDDGVKYRPDSDFPDDPSYLKNGFPDYLQFCIELMKKSWDTKDSGKPNFHWDLDWCQLNSEINMAELGGVISNEQADYLRKVYLRINEEDLNGIFDDEDTSAVIE